MSLPFGDDSHRDGDSAAPDGQTNEKKARFRMALGVFGDVPHYVNAKGDVEAFEPYVREMRIWADLFSQVHVYAPAGRGDSRPNAAPYLRQNVQWHPVHYSVRRGSRGARERMLGVPRALWAVYKGLRRSEFVLLRDPSHFGLMAAVLTRLFGRRSLTKWASNNGVFLGQPLASRLDWRLQAIPCRRNPVLVYGPAKYRHQVSFIPALMSEQELQKARDLSARKSWSEPWEILCVGRLNREKRFDQALLGLHELTLRYPTIPWRATVIGGGPERENLERLAEKAGISTRIRFTGPLEFAPVQEFYGKAHVLILPNPHEGWPKVIAEAWAHGAIPVAAEGGIVPHILSDALAGVMFDSSPAGLAEAVAGLLRDPPRMQAISSQIHRYAQDLSLEQFESRLVSVLVERCGLKPAE